MSGPPLSNILCLSFILHQPFSAVTAQTAWFKLVLDSRFAAETSSSHFLRSVFELVCLNSLSEVAYALSYRGSRQKIQNAREIPLPFERVWTAQMLFNRSVCDSMLSIRRTIEQNTNVEGTWDSHLHECYLHYLQQHYGWKKRSCYSTTAS